MLILALSLRHAEEKQKQNKTQIHKIMLLLLLWCHDPNLCIHLKLDQ